jgi:hypothetical protein
MRPAEYSSAHIISYFLMKCVGVCDHSRFADIFTLKLIRDRLYSRLVGNPEVGIPELVTSV